MAMQRDCYPKLKVMRLFLSTVAVFLLISCKKDSASCHYSLKIHNAGSRNITYAVTGLYQSHCFVTSRSVIRPGEIYEDERQECWEKILEQNDFEFYFLKPSLDPLGTSVLCDSSNGSSNVISKQRISASDLEYLNKNNFMFNFREL
jgi:hypothetical protein